jgi:hypothetical protein
MIEDTANLYIYVEYITIYSRIMSKSKYEIIFLLCFDCLYVGTRTWSAYNKCCVDSVQNFKGPHFPKILNN